MKGAKAMIGSKEVFAKNLNAIMAKKDIDRNKLVDDLGLKYTTVADWTRGRTYPRIDKLELLSDYLGVTLSELMEDKGSVVLNGDNNNLATMSGDNNGMTGSNYGTFNNINGNNNIANVGDNKFEGNVTFGSAIDKNDLHEVASNLNLTDRELQEKTLNELAKTKQELRELKDSQRRLENAMALLIENQVSVLSKIKNVDNSFQDILGKLSDK